jgi:hypothetical protein
VRSRARPNARAPHLRVRVRLEDVVVQRVAEPAAGRSERTEREEGERALGLGEIGGGVAKRLERRLPRRDLRRLVTHHPLEAAQRALDADGRARVLHVDSAVTGAPNFEMVTRVRDHIIFTCFSKAAPGHPVL